MFALTLALWHHAYTSGNALVPMLQLLHVGYTIPTCVEPQRDIVMGNIPNFVGKFPT